MAVMPMFGPEDRRVVASSPHSEHDDKGFSEEKCVRCGWVMGSPALNCQNDNTPHRFPSQVSLEEQLETANRDREALAAGIGEWLGSQGYSAAERAELFSSFLDSNPAKECDGSLNCQAQTHLHGCFSEARDV